MLQGGLGELSFQLKAYDISTTSKGMVLASSLKLWARSVAEGMLCFDLASWVTMGCSLSSTWRQRPVMHGAGPEELTFISWQEGPRLLCPRPHTSTTPARSATASQWIPCMALPDRGYSPRAGLAYLTVRLDSSSAVATSPSSQGRLAAGDGSLLSGEALWEGTGSGVHLLLPTWRPVVSSQVWNLLLTCHLHTLLAVVLLGSSA